MSIYTAEVGYAGRIKSHYVQTYGADSEQNDEALPAAFLEEA